MKHCDKNKESSYLQYKEVNNLHGRTMPQKLSVNNLRGPKILLNLMKIS